MQLPVYSEALNDLAVSKLNAFVTQHGKPADWTSLKAAEKRAKLLDMFKEQKELRKEFVVFYADTTGNEADFSEWETAPTTKAEEAEQKAEKGVATVPPADTVTITSPLTGTYVDGDFETIASEVAGLDAENSKKNLMEAQGRMEFEHIRIGALLSHIQSSQHYTTLGYNNMREFLAAETTMDYRKGTYLVSNYNKVRDLGIKPSELEGVTWSALRHIVPILSETNYKEWLDAARSLTHIALIAEVRQAVTAEQGALPAPKDEDGKPKPIAKQFNLWPDQKATVDAAIEKAKVSGNLDSPAAALEVIAASFTGKPVGTNTLAAVMPDMSDDGLKKQFSKIKSDEGTEGMLRVLEVIGELWPDVTINVKLPKAVAAE